jgi:pimeloyl-ACP methyl ester carboxylesterase
MWEAAMATVELEMGRIHYEEAGPPDGQPVVCVSGFIMGGSLWSALAERLAPRGFRVLMPDFPTGAHREPLAPGADVTPRGVAGIVAAFCAALDLHDVVLVGNDSGGAISQLVAVDRPERLGALVLTNCDTFEHFPPSFFKALVKTARIPGALKAALLPLRTAAARRSPVGYGLLSHSDVDHLAREWVRPVLSDERILDEVRRFTVAIDPALTIDAAARLEQFPGPILLAWGTDDKLFPPEHAQRLAAAVPHAHLELIPESRTFVMLDQPDRLATLIGGHILQSRNPTSGVLDCKI